MGQDEVHCFLFPHPHLVGISGGRGKIVPNEQNQPSEDTQLVHIILDPVFYRVQFSLRVDDEPPHGGPHIPLPATDLQMAYPPGILGRQLAEKELCWAMTRPCVVFLQESLRPANVPFQGIQFVQFQCHQYGAQAPMRSCSRARRWRRRREFQYPTWAVNPWLLEAM